MLVSRCGSICAFARISNRLVLRKGVMYIEGVAWMTRKFLAYSLTGSLPDAEALD